MLSALTRLMDAAAASPQRREVGNPATALAVRRSETYFDKRAPANDKAEAHMDSFRGTVYAAVDKIGRRIAQIQMELWQIENGLADELDDFQLFSHPILNVLGSRGRSRPHPEYTSWELSYWTSISLDLTGEAFWLIERDRFGLPARITPLPAHRMIVVFADDGTLGGYMYVPRGSSEHTGIFIPYFSPSDLQRPGRLRFPFIVHHRYPSPRGIEDPRGWAPMKAAAYAYDINLFEQIYKRNFLEQGAQLGGILMSEMHLNGDQIEEYLQQFKNRYSGNAKAGIPMVLPKFLKWETTEPNPRDLQWAEAIGLTRDEILQIYGISDQKLGRSDVGNRATADATDVTFNREVIQSRLDSRAAKLNADFVAVYPGQTDEMYFEIRYPDPVPVDTTLQLREERQDVELGVRVPNEIRKKRKLGEFGPFGNKVLVASTKVAVDPMGSGDELIPEPPEPLDPDANDDIDNNTDDSGDRRVRAVPVRSLNRESIDEQIAAILLFLESERAVSQFAAHLRQLVEELMEQEGQLAYELANGTANYEHTVAVQRWLVVMENQVRHVGKTTANLIREAVIVGMVDGEGIHEIAGRINDVFDYSDRVRSYVIARTEVLGASNAAANDAYRQAGSPYKGWLATQDDRTRDTHAEADGQIVRISEKFEVGEAALEHPGDPSGPAEEVIQCRCTEVPEDDPKRSAWTPERRRSIWDDYITRSDQWESEMRTAVRAAFAEQRDHVMALWEEVDA